MSNDDLEDFDVKAGRAHYDSDTWQWNATAETAMLLRSCGHCIPGVSWYRRMR